MPLIAGGFIYYEHPSRLVAVLLFMVCVIPVGFVLVRARLATGSIWPGVVLHGTHNSVIQGAFWATALAGGPAAAIWVGLETGILVAVTLVLAGMLLCCGPWTFRRTPDELMAAPASRGGGDR